MTSFEMRRKSLGSVVAVALGALAISVLPGLATAQNDDGASSATIKSFDPATSTLVVSLPEAETVTGSVTRRTKIRCEDQRGHRGHHGGDQIRSRESGPGESGDDKGGGSGSGRSGPSGHDDNGRGANCTADLVSGTAVEEVELDLNHGGVRFDEVELDD